MHQQWHTWHLVTCNYSFAIYFPFFLYTVFGVQIIKISSISAVAFDLKLINFVFCFHSNRLRQFIPNKSTCAITFWIWKVMRENPKQCNNAVRNDKIENRFYYKVHHYDLAVARCELRTNAFSRPEKPSRNQPFFFLFPPYCLAAGSHHGKCVSFLLIGSHRILCWFFFFRKLNY